MAKNEQVSGNKLAALNIVSRFCQTYSLLSYMRGVTIKPIRERRGFYQIEARTDAWDKDSFLAIEIYEDPNTAVWQVLTFFLANSGHRKELRSFPVGTIKFTVSIDDRGYVDFDQESQLRIAK